MIRTIEHGPITAAEPVGSLRDVNQALEAKRFRSLALQCRRSSHQDRAAARDMAARGHRSAAEGFTKSANRYASDALWYWMRSRREAVQFNTEDAA